MRRELSENDVSKLKSSGRINDDEIVLVEDGIVIAMNTKTAERRIVDTSGLTLEATRRLLLD